jgi:addiction module HigA family antidote
MELHEYTRNYYEPDYAVHPGEYLEEVLESREIKKREFAERVGLSVKAVSQIIHGKSLYSPEVALRFERVLGISSSIWSEMAQNYQLFTAREEEKRKLQSDQVKTWVKRFPVADLKKLHILPNSRSYAELAEALLRYLGLSSIEAWERYTQRRAAAYRQSECFKISPEAVEMWLTIAEREAETITTKPYSKKLFTEYLHTIRSFTYEDSDVFLPRMVDILAEAGVALVVVPELKGCRISGATRWLSKNKAMIALSLRYKSSDQFWFTFYHEAAHILLHKKKIFIDENGSDGRTEEKEADDYAGAILIPKAAFKKFISRKSFHEKDIRRFAEQIGIHPGIVVGRLQHEGLLDFSFLNALKQKLH